MCYLPFNNNNCYYNDPKYITDNYNSAIYDFTCIGVYIIYITNISQIYWVRYASNYQWYKYTHTTSIHSLINPSLFGIKIRFSKWKFSNNQQQATIFNATEDTVCDAASTAAATLSWVRGKLCWWWGWWVCVCVSVEVVVQVGRRENQQRRVNGAR